DVFAAVDVEGGRAGDAAARALGLVRLDRLGDAIAVEIGAERVEIEPELRGVANEVLAPGALPVGKQPIVPLPALVLATGHERGRKWSSTMRSVLPGGSTCSVFRNSITSSRSPAVRASKARRESAASPACARIDRRSVVNRP